MTRRQPSLASRFASFVALVVLILGAAGLGCLPASDDSRVVVIGIDSLDWSMVDPLIERGELPHLAALAERGWSAEMRTVEPLISPPNWTSIATGRSPEAHGITSFFADRRHVRVPTIWERLAAAGVRTGVYDVLMTWPPRELPDGVVIPSWLRRDDQVWPPDLADRLGAEPYAYRVLDMGDLDATVAEVDRELSHKADDFLKLMETFDLDVGFVTFYAVDVINHRFRHVAEPEAFEPPIPFEPQFADILLDTLRRIDAAVGTIVAGLDADDHVVIVSDHGSRIAVPTQRRWGYATGWMLDQAGLSNEDGVTALNGFIEAVFQVDDGAAEAREAAIDRLVEVVEGVRAVDGEPLFAVEVIRDPEAAVAAAPAGSFRADTMAPNLPAHAFVFVSVAHPDVDALWPGAEVVAGSTPLAIRELIQAHDFTGDHDPTAFFLAAGPAISPGLPRGTNRVVDVASWVLHLAGQPLPADLEGRSPAPWLDPEHLKANPVRVIPADQAVLLPPEPEPAAVETDDEVKRRLRALGYAD